MYHLVKLTVEEMLYRLAYLIKFTGVVVFDVRGDVGGG